MLFRSLWRHHNWTPEGTQDVYVNSVSWRRSCFHAPLNHQVFRAKGPLRLLAGGDGEGSPGWRGGSHLRRGRGAIPRAGEPASLPKPTSPRGPRHKSLPRSSCCLPAMPRDTWLGLNAHQLHGAGFVRTPPLMSSGGALCRKKNDTRRQSQEPFGCISLAAGMSRPVLWAVGSPSTMFTDLFVNVCSSFCLGVHVPHGLSLCWTQLLDVTVGSPGWESVSSLLLLPVVNKSEGR